MPEFDAVVAPKILSTFVDFGPEAQLEFSFDVNKVTPRWFKTQQQQLEAQDVEAVAKALFEILDSWNLTIAGEAAEPSVDLLSRFPLGHLTTMMEAIAELPTRAEGEVSSEPSPEPSTTSSEPPPTPPNGAATSDSPKPSESLSAA